MPERAILERLRAAVGTRNVLVDDAERAPYERDATGRYLGRAMAVVRPDSTEEVAAVLEVAHGAGLPVIPVGGNTGLSGGTFPGRDGRAIMLDLRRMNRIREIRPEARVAVVEAGVILDDLRAAAEAHDLVFPLVFGARGSCTIGGNL
ncbi:MAG: FAD-binding oxidoreductase, partial [Alphaproteobacteria bacterium]